MNATSKPWRWPPLALLTALSWACPMDVDPAPEPEPQPAAAVTYHRDLRPVVEAHCLSCHEGTGATPKFLDFRDPERLIQLAPVLAEAVATLTMPPWHAGAGCGDFLDDLSLTQADIDLFQGWIDEGLVLGEPEDFEARPQRISELGLDRLEGPATINIQPDEPYKPEGRASDDYRCFVVDPGFDTERFVLGYEVKVDNAPLVHHVILYAVSGDVETLETLAGFEGEDEAPGYECYGTTRLNSTEQVAATWVPGAGRVAYPARTGLTLEANTRFVVQIHYNFASEGEGTDQTSVDLWMLEAGQRPTFPARTLIRGNIPFIIAKDAIGTEAQDCPSLYLRTEGNELPPPAEGADGRGLMDGDLNAGDLGVMGIAGGTGCVQQDFFHKGPRTFRIWGLTPHMHTFGESISVAVHPIEVKADETRPEGAVTEVVEGGGCLLDVPRWDFDWQRTYWLRDPLEVPAEGLIRLTCRYDNDSGTILRYGDRSEDEMCLAIFYVTD